MALPFSPHVLRGEHYLDVLAPWICFDFETTNKRYGDARDPDNRIVCGAWKFGQGLAGPTRHWYGPGLPPEFLRDLRSAELCVAQHCKFECHWLLLHGIDPTDMLWADPMLFEWVLLGNNPEGQSLALDTLAPKYGQDGKDPFIDALMRGGVCPSEQPKHLLLDRCMRDVDSTAGVAEAQIALLAERGQLHLAAQRCMFAPILAVIERERIGLDRGRVLEQHDKYTKLVAELGTALADVSGPVSFNSPKQAIPLVYDVWPRVNVKNPAGKGRIWRDMSAAERAATGIVPLGFDELRDYRGKPKRGAMDNTWPEGRPKLNDDVLTVLARNPPNARAAKWLDLRDKMAKAYFALSKNLDFFKGAVLEHGGSFAADIMQGATATHRTVGRGQPQVFQLWPEEEKSVQSQNMPREFKSLQVAKRPGYKISDADAKQVEFRVAAHCGRDPVATADILNPRFDAHIQTLVVMLYGSRDRYDELLDRYKAGDKQVIWQRNDNDTCKSHTYKPLFGGERGTPEQERYYAWFREHYSGITQTCEGWLKSVVETGEVRAESGMVFRFDVEVRQRRNGEALAFNRRTGKPIKPTVYNNPVQELATGEIVPISVICLFYRCKGAGIRAHFTNTVHDSVSAEVHPLDWEPYKAAVFQSFTSDTLEWLETGYGIKFTVPLGCEVSLGDFLGEGVKASFDLRG